jgi:Uma2 family endonuclease
MTSSKIQTATQVLPLENGDRLSRIEFERRYTAMPKVKKAELVEGVVYMASPLRHRSHGQPHAAIMALLSAYWIATPGVNLGDNSTVRLDLDNEPQPDALLRIESGGRSFVSTDDYLEGAPELIVEIAASSAAYDLYDKKQVYRRNGVQEYVVWQIYENKLDWFSLTEGEYVLLQPDDNGVIKSLVFPGLWLAVPLLLAGEMVKAIAGAYLAVGGVQN